jgi:hypothetical protein
LEGYVVVLPHADRSRCGDSSYLGVDRLPAWAPDDFTTHFEAFRDVQRYVDEEWMSATIVDARRARDTLEGSIAAGEELELIWVTASAASREPPDAERRGLLGFDVCTPAPYESAICRRAPSPSGVAAIAGLNGNGLFDQQADAEAFRIATERSAPDVWAGALRVWTVYQIVDR